MGQDDDRFRDCRQRLSPLPQQVAQQALLDVIDIVGPLRDVIIEALEDLGISPQCAADGIFRPPVSIPYGTRQFLLQPLIVQHRQMGVKDRRVLLAQFLADGIAVPFDFGRCLSHSVRQPLQFRVNGATGNEPPGNPEALAVEHERFADGHPRRNGNTLKFEHGPPGDAGSSWTERGDRPGKGFHHRQSASHCPGARRRRLLV